MFVGGAASASNISAGVTGAMLGIMGYFMGACKLAVITIILSLIVIFFGLVASQGIIPGFENYDRAVSHLRSRPPRSIRGVFRGE